MSASDRLDSLAAAAAGRLARSGASHDCGCAKCRAAPAPGKKDRPRGWGGWTPPVSLSRIDRARTALGVGRRIAPALRPFLSPGPRLFRISRGGIDRDRPLGIGVTKGRASIGQCVADHYRRPGGGAAFLHRAIRNLPAGQILVQAARSGGDDMNSRRARHYQDWLQHRERPLLADPAGPTIRAPVYCCSC
jgi:hypothetical protein